MSAAEAEKLALTFKQTVAGGGQLVWLDGKNRTVKVVESVEKTRLGLRGGVFIGVEAFELKDFRCVTRVA